MGLSFRFPKFFFPFPERDRSTFEASNGRSVLQIKKVLNGMIIRAVRCNENGIITHELHEWMRIRGVCIKFSSEETAEAE